MRKYILWEFPRGSRAYDVIVVLILAFIFLTPREWFRDQPRASSIVMLPSEKNMAHFWVEPDVLAGLDEPARLAKANQLLKNRAGKQHKVSRLEPIFDSEQEIRGYMAYATE